MGHIVGRQCLTMGLPEAGQPGKRFPEREAQVGRGAELARHMRSQPAGRAGDRQPGDHGDAVARGYQRIGNHGELGELTHDPADPTGVQTTAPAPRHHTDMARIQPVVEQIRGLRDVLDLFQDESHVVGENRPIRAAPEVLGVGVFPPGCLRERTEKPHDPIHHWREQVRLPVGRHRTKLEQNGVEQPVLRHQIDGESPMCRDAPLPQLTRERSAARHTGDIVVTIEVDQPDRSFVDQCPGQRLHQAGKSRIRATQFRAAIDKRLGELPRQCGPVHLEAVRDGSPDSELRLLGGHRHLGPTPFVARLCGIRSLLARAISSGY